MGATRSCGDCGLCCKLLGVEALAKPPHSWCAHFVRGQGCAVYADRPRACADFSCYWLGQDALDDSWRPDRCGFVLHLSDQGRRMNVEVETSRPLAWRAEPYHATFRRWAAGGRARDLELTVWIGRRCWRIQPDRDVDLGLVRGRLQAPAPALRP